MHWKMVPKKDSSKIKIISEKKQKPFAMVRIWIRNLVFMQLMAGEDNLAWLYNLNVLETIIIHISKNISNLRAIKKRTKIKLRIKI